MFETYRKISSHLASIINEYNNFSLLGRSAGGGLSLQLGLSMLPNILGLNLACPGYKMDDILPRIQQGNKDLPIRLCWAREDIKIVEDNTNPDGGFHLGKQFTNNEYTNFKYLLMSTGGNAEHIHTHRIQPILIENLV